MRRPLINRGMSAHIASIKLTRILEMKLEIARTELDLALDFGLDVLAKTATIKILRLVREIAERGGIYGQRVFYF